MTDTSTRIVVTTAPAAYDYESTVLASEDIATGQRDRVYRMVTLDNRDRGYYADYQIGRYHSGMYLVQTLEQFQELQDCYPNLL